MTRNEALVALNLSMDIGAVRLQRLLEVFGTPEKIFDAPCEQLSAVQGIGSHIARSLAGFRPSMLEEELSAASKAGITLVTIYDESYPRNLLFIDDRPIVLYVKGTLAENDALAIAIVGCRRPSFYGIEQAQRFSEEFGRRNITVISGLARGIDTCSHEGALKAKARTIAVIGSGLGHIYPPENEALAQRIACSGAVISEFPINSGPQRFNFPRRNRIISGLALGVLVVEAGRNSGSLITARYCLEQGRDVFALPGKVDTPQAFGTNSLIKDGACLVNSVDDVLENLPFLAVSATGPMMSTKPAETDKGSLSCLESTLYNIISCHPVAIEALMEQTHLGIAQLSSILLGLQMKRLITQASAGTYIRSPNAR